jgi:hypothetical protein
MAVGFREVEALLRAQFEAARIHGLQPTARTANESAHPEISYRTAELSRDSAHILGTIGTGEAGQEAVRP